LSTEIALRDELNRHLLAQEQTNLEQKTELEKAHSRLKEAIDILPEGIVILDADNRYVAWTLRSQGRSARYLSHVLARTGCEGQSAESP
jgi:hypothetical protein